MEKASMVLEIKDTTNDTKSQLENRIDVQACLNYLHALVVIDPKKGQLPNPRPNFGEYELAVRNAEKFVQNNRAGGIAAQNRINTLIKNIPPLAAMPEAQARVEGEEDPEFDAHFLEFKDLRKLSKPEWLIYGVLPAKGINFLVSAPKAGKTYLAVTIAGTVALAPSGNDVLDALDADKLNWAGQVTRHGDVMYIAAEAIEDIAQRFVAWAKLHNIPDSELSHLHLFECPLRLATDTERFMSALDRRYKDATFKLIVIDTLAMCSLGIEENSKKEFDAVIASMEVLWRKYNCCVLVVHHTGRNGAIRGTSAMDGVTYSLMKVERVDERIALKSELQRRGKNFDTMYFDWQIVELDHLDETGNTATESVLVKSDWKAATKAEELTKNQQIILDIIKALGGKEIARTDVKNKCKMSNQTFISATKALNTKNLIDISTRSNKDYYTLQGCKEGESQNNTDLSV